MKTIPLLWGLGTLLLLPSCDRSETSVPQTKPSIREVHLLNWEEYLPDLIIERFEKATGYQIVQHFFENTDDQIGWMTAYPHHYDVIIIGHSDLPVAINRSLIRKLAPEKLSGTERISEKYRKLPNDPDDRYTIPYLWGGFAVAYRKDLVHNPKPSLGLFFENDVAGKRLIFDESVDVVAVANTYLGKSIKDYSHDTLDLATKAITQAARSNEIEFQPSSKMIGSLIEGDFVVAVNYSGDIAAASEENPNIGFFLPQEGTQLWLDTLTISRDSPNPEGAYAFINFLLEPENIAEVSNELWYPNAIPESNPMIDEELRANPSLFPPEDMVAQWQWRTCPTGEDVKKVARFFRNVRKSCAGPSKSLSAISKPD